MLVLATALGWGLNWPVVKALLDQGWPPLTVRVTTALAGAVLLGLIALMRRDSLAIPRGHRVWTASISILNFSGWMGFATLGMQRMPAGEASIVAYTMPIWAAALAAPVLGERLSAGRIIALALGVGGLLLIVWPALGGGSMAQAGRASGVALTMVAAVSFAFGTVLTKRRPLPLPLATGAFWQVLFGTIPLALVALVVEQPSSARLPAPDWALLGYAAAVPLGLCYLTWFAGLARLPAGSAAIGMLATPVVGMIASALALGEAFGLRQAGALVLVIAAVAMAARSR